MTANIEDYQTRIDTANSARARAEVERDNAVKRLKDAQQALENEFSVKTAADAKRVQKELQDEVDRLTAEVEKALEEAGA